MKPYWQKVAIVGVGLLGGSLALALRQRRLAGTLLGIGRNESSLQRAQAAGVVDVVATDLAAVADSDLIVLCTPVATMVEQIPRLSELLAESRQAGDLRPLVVDVGSTKQTIVDTAHRCDLRFLGCHPIAGSEQRGWEHADAALFEDQLVVLTPSEHSSAATVEEATSLWQAVGSRVWSTTAAEHDRLLAATSHLPHLVAAVLAATAAEDQLPRVGRGWLDTTRVASGGVELWQQILATNREAILEAMDHFASEFATLHSAIRQNNWEVVRDLLQRGKANRDRVGS